MDKYRQGSGLIKPKYDPRRFSYKKRFGSFPIGQVPNDFIVGEPTLYEQKFNDICTAVSTCYASEVQEGVPLSPEYTFYKTKLIMGGDYRAFGADPDSACKSHIKYGAIKRDETPYQLLINGRDFIANSDNWNRNLDEGAKQFKKFSYFKADNQNDLFDSIRAVLWENKEKKRLVMTGANVKSGWFDSPVVSKTDTNEIGSPDMFVIIGSKMLVGEPHLIANFSFGGKEKGDGGKFYFPRNIVNKYFFFAYLFVDVDPANYKQQQWSFIQILYNYVQILKNWLLIKKEKSVEPIIPIDQSNPPIAPPIVIVSPVYAPPDPPKPTQIMEQMARRVCLEEGLTPELTKITIATIWAESGMNPSKVSFPNKNGTRDWGISQFNDGKNKQGVPFWIGQGAAFKDTYEVVNNPEKCVRVMAREVKRGKITWWSSYNNGSYRQFMV